MPELLTPVEDADISVRSNWLLLKRKKMRANVLDHTPEKIVVSSDQLHQILIVGRRAVLSGIVDFNHPGADTTPSIWTIQLGSSDQIDGRDGKLYTEKGYKNGGVRESVDEIQAQFHAYWNAIRDAGFRPEVRGVSGKSMDAGAWMLLRQPTLRQVSEDWLGYEEDPRISKLRRRFIDNEAVSVPVLSDKAKRRIIAIARDTQAEFTEGKDDEMYAAGATPEQSIEYRARQHVGGQLGIIGLELAMRYDDTVDDDIEDALTYASSNPAIDWSAVLALENAIY